MIPSLTPMKRPKLKPRKKASGMALVQALAPRIAATSEARNEASPLPKRREEAAAAGPVATRGAEVDLAMAGSAQALEAEDAPLPGGEVAAAAAAGTGTSEEVEVAVTGRGREVEVPHDEDSGATTDPEAGVHADEGPPITGATTEAGLGAEVAVADLVAAGAIGLVAVIAARGDLETGVRNPR
mmetsp:Transcript_20126/g.43904  ORF Transcript_20126/g.43904 Transcript_20126/m.43904 type:complete len:184 (-) Transcript_20126:142-693(-)